MNNKRSATSDIALPTKRPCCEEYPRVNWHHDESGKMDFKCGVCFVYDYQWVKGCIAEGCKNTVCQQCWEDFVPEDHFWVDVDEEEGFLCRECVQEALVLLAEKRAKKNK